MGRSLKKKNGYASQIEKPALERETLAQSEARIRNTIQFDAHQKPFFCWRLLYLLWPQKRFVGLDFQGLLG